MLDILFKKKISEDQIATQFVENILPLVDTTFEDVAELVCSDPNFADQPHIDPDRFDPFLLIVIAGNIKMISKTFRDYRDTRIIEKVYNKLSVELGCDPEDLTKAIADYHGLFSRLNYPSKNTLYAMSKTFFEKYALNQYQEPYFKKMKSPNPNILKRLDEIMANFLWDWEGYDKNFKVVN